MDGWLQFDSPKAAGSMDMKIKQSQEYKSYLFCFLYHNCIE